MFEISIVVRDSVGEPVRDSSGNPKRKLISATNGRDLYYEWQKNCFSAKQVARRQYKSNNKGATQNRRQSEKIVRKKKRFDDGENPKGKDRQ